MIKFIKRAAAAAGIAAAAEAGISAYFYRRTMKRSKAKTERTMKMAGTDWSQYFGVIGERKERLLNQPHDDVWITSDDGLKLHGTYFKGTREENDSENMSGAGENKAVICFHGYTSQGMNDYIGLSDYYLRNGYRLLLVDERAHGESEGEYIGFGCKDRYDALGWIRWMIEEAREDVQILLHGISMGGATVLMASALELPEQVKGIISDCAFTSPKDVFTHVLHSMYHMPAFPIIQISDYVNQKKAGYGLDECNAAREVRKAKIPVLLIHGDHDTFVPTEMCHEIYSNYAGPKKKLIISGAAHAECYYKDMEAYESAMDEFIGGIVK